MFRLAFLLLALATAFPVSAELVTFVAKGDREQTLIIYSSADTERMVELIGAFQKRNPGVAVDYHLLDTLDIHRRAVDEMEAARPTADLLLSSAMTCRSSWSTTATPRPTPPKRPTPCRFGPTGATKPSGSPMNRR